MKEEKGVLMKLLFLSDRDLDKRTGESSHVIQIVNSLVHVGETTLTFLTLKTCQQVSNEVRQLAFADRFPNNRLSRLLSYSVMLWMLTKEKRSDRIDAVYIRMSLPMMPSIPLLRAVIGKSIMIIELNGLALDELQAQGRFPLAQRFLRLFETRLLNLADGIVVVAEPIKSSLEERGVRGISVVSNGADTDRFAPQEDSQEIREKSHISGNGPIVGFVGHVTIWQGLETLVRSAPRVLEQFPSAVFLIVGGGEHLAPIKQLAGELEVIDSFHFTGPVHHHLVPDYISTFTCAVTPTADLKGAGPGRSSLKTFEYMACGIPTVVSNFPGLAQEVEKHGVGFVVQPGSPDELAKGICRALALTPAERKRIGERSRSLIVDGYSWDHSAREIHALISAISTCKYPKSNIEHFGAQCHRFKNS